MSLLPFRTCLPYLLESEDNVRLLFSVADDYEFICPALPFYYDPVTYQPVFLIDRLHGEFRADFLIRHRDTKEAVLIDLVHRSWVNDQRLRLRNRIARNYIQWKGYDWNYHCVIAEDILLSYSASALFQSFRHLQSVGNRSACISDYLSLIHCLKPEPFQTSEYSLLDFLIHGILPNPINTDTIC